MITSTDSFRRRVLHKLLAAGFSFHRKVRGSFSYSYHLIRFTSSLCVPSDYSHVFNICVIYKYVYESYPNPGLMESEIKIKDRQKETE